MMEKTSNELKHPLREWFAIILTTYRNQSTGEVFSTEDFYTLKAIELEPAEMILEARIAKIPNEFENTQGETIQILKTEIINVGELAIYPTDSPFERRFVKSAKQYKSLFIDSYEEWFHLTQSLRQGVPT